MMMISQAMRERELAEAARDIALMQENIREGKQVEESRAVIAAYVERLQSLGLMPNPLP
jgi:hypothetical protein